jgi:hypothetical protein
MAVLMQPKPTGAFEPRFAPATSQATIDLYWLPLGAGGWFVRLNGRIYEAIHALLEQRWPLDFHYSALEVRLTEGRFVMENSWPILMSTVHREAWSFKAQLGAAGWHAFAFCIEIAGY